MAALLLWLGTGALGDINPNHLQTIIQYITAYGVNVQYAFAVSLPADICRDPSGLVQELPEQELLAMQVAIRRSGGLYNPIKGHIVAAQVRYRGQTLREHSEWRLLQGGQNSPVQQLLAQSPREQRCLIFFTRDSPCLGTCLNVQRDHNILEMVRATFGLASNNYKAFVFRNIYQRDQDAGNLTALLEAWHRLSNVPLLRCNNNGCWDCAGDNTPNRPNPCLEGMHPSARGK